MSDLKQKILNLNSAVLRLQESIADYQQFHMNSIRDGAIQRFEFCMELAWKTCREYLLDQGYPPINSPKAVMREAYAYGMLNDEKLWVHALTDRNLTSHVYDEKTADEIYSRICTEYLPILQALSAYLSEK